MQRLSKEEFAQRIDEFLLPIGAQAGRLVHSLIVGMGAKVVVEVGASYGYSTLWMAEAVSHTQGRLISIELAEEKHQYARDMLEQAGLLEYVQFETGDALHVLKKAPAAPFDLVLLDLWKDYYIPCFDLILDKLSPAAVVVADNMLFPEDSAMATASYRQHVRSHPKTRSILLHVGNGLELTQLAQTT